MHRLTVNLHDAIVSRGDVPDSPGPRPSVFTLFCPRCQTASNTARHRLFYRNRWVQIRCKYCKNVSASSKWHCPCGQYWKNCSSHRAIGFKCGRLSPPRAGNRNKRDVHAAIIRRLGPLGEPIRLSSDEGNYKKVRKLIGGCVADSINCLFVFPAVSHGTKSTDLSCGECTGVFADALLYTRSAENVSCIESSGVSNTCNKRARRTDRNPDAFISRKRKFLRHLQHIIGCEGSETGSVSDHPNAFFAYPNSSNKQSRELSPPRFNLHYGRKGSAVSSQFSLEDAAIVAELNAILMEGITALAVLVSLQCRSCLLLLKLSITLF